MEPIAPPHRRRGISNRLVGVYLALGLLIAVMEMEPDNRLLPGAIAAAASPSRCRDVGEDNPGGSDCPDMVEYCDHPAYAEFMEDECPYTCGYCDDDDYQGRRGRKAKNRGRRAENYTLFYLNFRGRGEESRLLFRYAKVPFNDVRYTREYWTRELKNKTMYGLLPILQLGDGRRIAQSYAIERFLARRFGLAGRGEFEQAKVDEFADFHKDVDNEFYAQGFITSEVDPKKDVKVLKALFDQYFPFYSRQLDSSSSSSGFLFPSGVTWVDFVVANWFESIRNLHEAEWKEQRPELEKYRQRVNSLPQIADYIRNRPFSIL